MSDIETIMECLPQINPAILEYDEWLAVGMAIKDAGGSVQLWEEWSRRDPQRYRENECSKKWTGFHGNSTPVGVGTVVKLCRDQGGEISAVSSDGTGRALDWDFVLPADDMRIVRQEWLQDSQLPPTPKDWSGLNDFRDYLTSLFNTDEFVGIVADAYSTDGKWMPKKGEFTRTAGELLEEAAKASDLGAVIGDWPECGAWVRFNPLDGKGVADSNVAAYRYALVESDGISVERQYTIYHELELPIAALVHSGGKSLHAIVKIDAPDFKEYQKRVNFLYEVCKRNGLVVDCKNRNPSRLSRLPGVTRNGIPQRLIEVNTGKASWSEWAEWIAALNDDLPDFEPLAAFIKSPPPLAEELIEGILRKGHKMLVSGPSKAGKSFLLLELVSAVASGGQWLGWQCRKGRALYINLELDRASCYHRIKNMFEALRIKEEYAENIDTWQLRGNSKTMDQLLPSLIRRALSEKKAGRGYSLIVIDPIYKVITGDENAADQMAKFCNNFDQLAKSIGCAVVYCHHHSKGDQGQKRAQDRASGSGVFARDPDALIDMIELEIDDDRRKQLINQWGVEAVQNLLDIYHPDWQEDVGQDDTLVLDRLTAYARGKLPSDTIESVIEKFNKEAARATGWRIHGILREFPTFEPRNCFFRYPYHPLDNRELLTDAGASGQLSRNKKKQHHQKSAYNSDDVPSAREMRIAQTRLIVENSAKCGEVTVAEIQKELELTSIEGARKRLKEAGFTYKMGRVIVPTAENTPKESDNA